MRSLIALSFILLTAACQQAPNSDLSSYVGPASLQIVHHEKRLYAISNLELASVEMYVNGKKMTIGQVKQQDSDKMAFHTQELTLEVQSLIFAKALTKDNKPLETVLRYTDGVDGLQLVDIGGNALRYKAGNMQIMHAYDRFYVTSDAALVDLKVIVDGKYFYAKEKKSSNYAHSYYTDYAKIQGVKQIFVLEGSGTAKRFVTLKVEKTTIGEALVTSEDTTIPKEPVKKAAPSFSSCPSCQRW